MGFCRAGEATGPMLSFAGFGFALGEPPRLHLFLHHGSTPVLVLLLHIPSSFSFSTMGSSECELSFCTREAFPSPALLPHAWSIPLSVSLLHHGSIRSSALLLHHGKTLTLLLLLREGSIPIRSAFAGGKHPWLGLGFAPLEPPHLRFALAPLEHPAMSSPHATLSETSFARTSHGCQGEKTRGMMQGEDISPFTPSRAVPAPFPVSWGAPGRSGACSPGLFRLAPCIFCGCVGKALPPFGALRGTGESNLPLLAFLTKGSPHHGPCTQSKFPCLPRVGSDPASGPMVCSHGNAWDRQKSACFIYIYYFFFCRKFEKNK